MELYVQVYCLFLVAILWGVTNPLMKAGSKGVENAKLGSRYWGWLAELLFLVRQWQYVASFLLNQSGSVLFYWTVSRSDVSLVVPVTNSLTLVVTTVAGRVLLKEGALPWRSYAGMALTLTGVTLCVWAKT